MRNTGPQSLYKYVVWPANYGMLDDFGLDKLQ